ncbi:OmpH family outer membrane protein [Mucilaginibacter auburnensis]|uniref:Outer membrane protein n=1 Tax=Mucilaginibacter auburnensis TaxID=1457233 RepID=A0A2H9VNX3_9SPHI|nr:OmpH family outer membrane protein [Mucilaginibacter auburnensis]PJJ80059.1 outer membrane protein [Mucilaginibacter auburnensis]
MKTTGSIFNKITLGVLVAVSVAACNNEKKSDAPATAASAGSTAKETIVFVNQDTLLAKYEYAKDVNTKLQGKGKNADSDLNSRGQAFQREVAEYQRNANTMSADQRASTEQRLQRKQQELQQYQQNAAAELQNEQGTEANKLYEKIAEFTKGYAKQNGYKMVLTYSRANPTVLYGDTTLDVTADVLKKLNDAYAKDKK